MDQEDDMGHHSIPLDAADAGPAGTMAGPGSFDGSGRLGMSVQGRREAERIADEAMREWNRYIAIHGHFADDQDID
ncbi:type II toxin-antitoxin system CcdA family antitoxin [Aerophototrophica crusticola]|uniref:Type II toxin-antitoxin system CcdA family antitoxin n=1 Tax=Aerophototrophica crusticola TaxID=1709002 RepID=A0A858R3I9_9PROT|nr:type II toxin-antitoxin system CcdA family antitoxin [Rhodospirillaceae bacterium B3]